MKRALATITLSLCLTTAAAAQVQNSAPQPLPPPAPLPVPRDIPFPGVMKVYVDATDLDRRIFRFRQTIPVSRAGDMVLLYTQWLPGNHSPSSVLRNVTGLSFKVDGKPVAWTRDVGNVYGFHIPIPAGAKELQIEGQYVSALETGQGGVVMTREMVRVQWYPTAFYPAGYFTRQIQVEQSVKLPTGWGFGTALETASTAGDMTTFKTVSFDTLADSPMFAGKYYRRIELDPGGRSRVSLNVVADSADQLEAKPEVIEIHRELIRQFDKLYGARHFDHYDFLLSLSDRLGGSGLEHHRSSENGVDPKYFTAWDKELNSRDLLAHEGNHSWNGKYRRGADLWTPDFSTPMRDSLLWVYEGQTQFWGNVLAARAGFVTRQQALDFLANTAAAYDTQPGRAWRPLQDTTNDPIIAQRAAIPWRAWQRSEDYYSEGQLIWLDVDTLIRERSKGARSLDDFAKVFFGMNDGDWGELTYKFEDVVAALNKVEPYDWATLLRRHLDETGVPILDGVTRGGYRLIYTDEPNEVFKANETRGKVTNLTYSLGAVFDATGRMSGVLWDSPVFKAGLVGGNQIVAVNGVAYDGDKLKAAVKATKTGGPPIEFLIRQGDLYKTIRLDYAGGLRYPRLERIAGSPALLDDILAKK